MAAPTVLVVDAEPSLRALVTDMLRERGFSCGEATDGFEALEILRTETFGLLILDLAMPGVRAPALLRALRLARPSPPIVAMVPSDAPRGAEEDARMSGAASVLRKPIDEAALIEAVERLLRGGWAAPEGEDP